MMPYQFYTEQIRERKKIHDALRSKLNLLSWTRLALVVLIGTAIYFAVTDLNSAWWSIVAAILTVGFLILVRIYFQVKDSKLFQEKTILLCERELAARDFQKYPWEDGEVFNGAEHPYANDLDIVGPNSLFQFINRTHTFLGKQRLAHALLTPDLDIQLIQERQAAIQELAKDRLWSLEFEAFSELGKDNAETAHYIQDWQEIPPLSFIYRVITWVMTALGASSMVALIVTGDIKWFSLGTMLFAINLVVFGMVAKRILKELGTLDRIFVTFKSYARLLEKIEQASWHAALLNDIQGRLEASSGHSSKELRELSQIFSNLESMRNGFVLIHFNGTIFYHVHQFHRLIQWRRKNGQQIQEWVNAIAEIEALVSLSVFAHNHPEFVYPELNQEHHIGFEDLVHPLIAAEKCVSNSISFQEHGFVILTGSNMSGKSTFLRSFGIALVLANAGSVVPAKRGHLHPIQVLASMRLKDSLADSTSYFFAEIKRMQFIMETVREQRCFVLLDELLRGTNSDDKIAGTIGIVEQMATLKAIGIIATHDLEVCETADKFPNYVTNKCFEANIENEQLHFDYRLRPGICKNRSASFLLEQYRVIPRKNG